MLYFIGIILTFGIIFAKTFEKIGLAPILGMLFAGIIISPHQLGLVGDEISQISGDLRQIALVVILSRAGLFLDFNKLKTVGRPAILLSFLPATIEMLAITYLAPKFFGIDTIDGAILAAVLAAVSPAIVVPRMIRLIDEGYGRDKNIPEMILAGASVDDVFVIVFFTSFLALKTGGELSIQSFIIIPISIGLGIGIGVMFGKILGWVLQKIEVNSIYQALIYLSGSFLLLKTQDFMENIIPFSALISIMVVGMILNQENKELGQNLLKTYSSLWSIFEVFLFVLVGIAVDLSYVRKAGILAVFLILIGLVFRMIGVNLSLISTNLNRDEKLFTSFAYLPKATVQAAIGPVALQMGLDSGKLILSLAVIAILITAPLGAILTDKTYKTLLKKS